MNNSLFFKRSLNTKGQSILARLEFGFGLIFSFVVLVYAIIRSNKITYQLPTTFQTNAVPQEMPTGLLNGLFQTHIPSPSYEFPAVTICPEVGESIGIISCYSLKSTSGDKVPCNDSGIYQRTVNFAGSDRLCMTVNDLPGTALAATHEGDIFTTIVSIGGQITGSPSGVFAVAHSHKGREVTPVMTFDNFFGAGAGTASQVMSK